MRVVTPARVTDSQAAQSVQAATQDLADATSALIEQIDEVNFPARFESMEEAIQSSAATLDASQDELKETIDRHSEQQEWALTDTKQHLRLLLLIVGGMVLINIVVVLFA